VNSTPASLGRLFCPKCDRPFSRKFLLRALEDRGSKRAHRRASRLSSFSNRSRLTIAIFWCAVLRLLVLAFCITSCIGGAAGVASMPLTLRRRTATGGASAPRDDASQPGRPRKAAGRAARTPAENDLPGAALHKRALHESNHFFVQQLSPARQPLRHGIFAQPQLVRYALYRLLLALEQN